MDGYPAPTNADILIVDDTLDNVRLLSNMLQGQGYTVRKALSGQMALTAVRTLLPDLILLDVNMPEMNGYEVCKQLKEDAQTCSVPIIFLSALDSVSDKVKAFRVGGIDYITKPFQLEEVLARIETQLTLRALQTQLQQKNETLQQTLNDLRKAQAKLIQQEKMLGLSQLVAGMSHEINNPISFIAGNLAPARQYFNDLLNLIQIYQQEVPNPTPAIQKALQASELEFLIPDLNKLLNSMQTGVERIRGMMLAFRIFSRLDEATIKRVDIHQGIDSTLLLLQHRIRQHGQRPDIQIVKHYGTIPPVTCYASQLNQVFLNLLNNAIDALELSMGNFHPSFAFDRAATETDQEHTTAPTIWIRTELTVEQTVRIGIKDNGPGIEEAARSRMFEPFYTTKPVGKGMGLGLSISYEIVVEKHKGQLICHSSPEGAEFIVEVPLSTVDYSEARKLGIGRSPWSVKSTN
ncbi:hybrid sensor histidine kinase/response regulator [Leptolyngbya sp. FACHB-36]|uniref:hybrid sensor histidine kinase/response regulator n=1 Tax=Leptolyngbya sp. FACHB-36 TaxID=2692808 RepID=UPI001680BA20|nr:response regulator [Leptolyngbya sp. FACHB-36]MBD2019734.1 hybrid sensor histidine kinase/response regulator [Leptolyngbya sp. FACHB-36]